MLFSDMLYMLVRYASRSDPVLKMPDVDCIRPCGVLVFSLLYCGLDLWCGKCCFGCLQFVWFPIYVSVCVVHVLCLTVLVNCLLNAFSNCVGEVNVLSLKVIGLCWFLGG